MSALEIVATQQTPCASVRYGPSYWDSVIPRPPTWSKLPDFPKSLPLKDLAPVTALDLAV